MNGLTLICAVTLGLGASFDRAVAGTVDSISAQCEGLVRVDFSRIRDAPTQVTESRVVEPSDDTPGYCGVRGYVAPTVGFFLKLPIQNWNGKFLELGCGGFCGGTPVAFEKLANAGSTGPLRRGYAVVTFDGGRATVVSASALWAYDNLPAQFDFGIRAPHVVALAGKAITERYYGLPPSKAYFCGCSTGGQQALSEAQRFPWDFNGIISGAPSPTFSGPMMNYLWAGRALSGVVSSTDLKLVHDRAVAQCDLDDGVRDGVIGDPLHCHFDPSDLLCDSSVKSSNCLTSAQLDAIRKVYSGPTTSNGEKIYSGGPLPGSELNWIPGYVDDSGTLVPWSAEYFAYVGFMPAPGPNWKPSDFDFDRDYKRLRAAESLFGAADNPDLRKFKAAGSKLLMYQGGQDESDIPTDAIDYYETAQRTMGGRGPTQAFFRLFFIPGMNHCTGGPGAFAIDYLTYLEAWVEKKQAPDKLIGAHIEVADPIRLWTLSFPLDRSIAISFTRPVYPYPARARYRGRGDPTNAANFDSVSP